MTVAPVLALGLVAWQVWGDFLRWSDVIVFSIMYLATGLGVTVGFHRYFTHRSFKTSKPVRATLAVLGSIAIEGPIISWVADHRKHHTFSDQEGDPHSPHVDHGVRLARRAQAALPTRTWAGCSSTPSAGCGGATRAT